MHFELDAWRHNRIVPGEGILNKQKTFWAEMKKAKRDPRQLSLTQHIKTQINHFADSERSESRTSMSGVKLTATQDETLKSFSTATGFSVSTIISNSLKLYFAFFDQLEKLIRYKSAVVSLLNSLP